MVQQATKDVVRATGQALWTVAAAGHEISEEAILPDNRRRLRNFVLPTESKAGNSHIKEKA